MLLYIIVQHFALYRSEFLHSWNACVCNIHESLHVRVCPFAVPTCPCDQWFVSVCLLSRALRHWAICNQAGSQEAHIGAHMAGHHAPAQSPPTQSHADKCTCLYSTSKCEIIMCAFPVCSSQLLMFFVLCQELYHLPSLCLFTVIHWQLAVQTKVSSFSLLLHAHPASFLKKKKMPKH